jgi:hypothetical protein
MRLLKRFLSLTFAALIVGTGVSVVVSAQPPPADPLIKESAIAKVSDRLRFPISTSASSRVSIIVGTKATLVVDTGLGAGNGRPFFTRPTA